MKVRSLRHPHAVARLKEAKRVTARKRMAEIMAEMIYNETRRVGFARRFLAKGPWPPKPSAPLISTARDQFLNPGRYGVEMSNGVLSIVPPEGAPGYIDIPSDT